MKHLKATTIGLSVLLVTGCATKQGTFSAVGGGAGAVVGGIIGNIIGKDSKATAIGAAIGAAVGAGTGAIIGHRMDKIAKETAAQVPNARVEEVTDANGLKMVKVSLPSGMLFNLNSSSLSDASKTDLANFAKVMNNNTDCSINVYGHTDKTGNDKINDPLSLKRAQSVVTCLKENGVGNSQFKEIKGMGSKDPVAGHENTIEDETNRRVEIYVYASEDMINQAKRQAGEN